MADLLLEQITDPFRIGLLFFLLLTTRQTAAATGTVLPLLAGVTFIAILIPMTLTSDAGDWWMRVVAGLAVNCAVMLILILAFGAYDRMRHRGSGNRT